MVRYQRRSIYRHGIAFFVTLRLIGDGVIFNKILKKNIFIYY